LFHLFRFFDFYSYKLIFEMCSVYRGDWKLHREQHKINIKKSEDFELGKRGTI